MKFLFVDPEKCTGCMQCALACSLKKFGECNPKKSAITLVRDEFDKFEMPVFCFQCEEAPCLAACSVNALYREDGIVKYDKEKCIGCRLCAIVCPFSAITTYQRDVIKCDLCGGDPTCVKYCATKAIVYEEELTEANIRRKEYVKRFLETRKVST
jgi:carbon-monoxide dehydrogenase iron sulfur subunit